MQYTYHVFNTGDSPIVWAEVRNPFGTVIFTINDKAIVEKGIINDLKDAEGLLQYLKDIKELYPTDTLILSEGLLPTNKSTLWVNLRISRLKKIRPFVNVQISKEHRLKP